MQACAMNHKNKIQFPKICKLKKKKKKIDDDLEIIKILSLFQKLGTDKWSKKKSYRQENGNILEISVKNCVKLKIIFLCIRQTIN